MKKLYLPLFIISLLFSFKVQGQMVVDFTSNTQTGCDFETISFTNTSTDGGAAINCSGNYTYAWDFNPGTSAQCSPGNIFSTPGTYTVCLTVTNATNESVTECKTDYITIFELPVPNFTFSPTSGCAPSEICFQNTTALQSGSLVQCIWDFADGTVVQDCANQVCHTFDLGGTYNVSLTVIDDNGCSPVTMTNPVQVDVVPVINTVSDQNFSCTPPLFVDYSNTSPTTNNITFNWFFEGANTPFFQGNNPPPITWNSQGDFDVTIIAVNDLTGCSDTLLLENDISIGSSVSYSPSAYSLCLGDTLFLTDLSAGNPNLWSWDFGDGLGTSTQQNPFYVYTAPGCYNITLDSDNGACIGTYTDPTCITIETVPTLSFTNDNPLACEIPLTVNFNSLAVGAGISSYDWVFGDSLGFSNVADPSFTFTEFGIHPVTLVATTSGGGCTVTFEDTIRIEEIEVDLLGTSVEGCVPVTVTLNETSTSVAPINDWVWTIPGIGSFNQQSPTVMATDTGVYDVILQVTNTFGCVQTDTFFSYIQTGVPQMVEFSADPLLTCIDTAIQFTDMSSPLVDEWFWQFGEGPGSVSFEQNPSHEYIDTGFFEVCLTVFQNGCPNTLCKPDYVYLIPPRAAVVDSFDCSNPYQHFFSDRSIGADSVFYDFGVLDVDTDTTSVRNPIFVFPDTGTYIVTQQAFNFGTGCEDLGQTVVIVSDPTANFIINDTIGCVPFNLDITDLSSSATSWNWTSENFSASINDPNTQNSSITYLAPNLYEENIQLIVADSFGCRDTFVTPSSIYANDVIAGFTLSDTLACAPTEVFFVDTSSNVLFNNVQWEWNYNIGQGFVNYNSTSVSNIFTDAGSYNVKVRVTDEIGCVDEQLHVLVIQDVYPSFFGDTVACTEQNVNFINTSTADGNNINYLWDFGDGNTSTDISPIHSYEFEGMYDVCLTMSNGLGCDSTLCLPNFVNVINPVADLVADTTFAFCPPLVVNFTSTSLNTVNGGYTWDFGDNTGLSNADNPSHVYTGAGIYDITLIATSPSGCLDTIVYEDYIELRGPVGSFSFEPDFGCVPLTVTFYTESALPVLHVMDYGDGSIDSSSTNVAQDTFVYTYTQAGDYVPALILIDELGCDQVFDADSSITVESLIIDFMATDTLLCDGGITDFTSNIQSSEPITFLEWDFEGQSPSTSTDPNPTNFTYNNFGEYDVMLTVSNGVCTDSLLKPNYIIVEPKPDAMFSPNPLSGCVPEIITFTDQSTVVPGVITDWSWDFGDMDTSVLSNPAHNYTDVGDYTVTLEVTTENGCKDTTLTNVSILEVPDVTTLPGGIICIGQVFQLEAQILTDPTGVLVSWDNTGSLSCNDCLNPVASPSITTTYTVTIIHPNGCTDTDQVTIDVNPFPVPNIGLDVDTTICEGETIQLVATGGTVPSSYQWDTNSAGLSCYECANPFATPTANTTYSVTVTGPGGCIASDTINVIVFDPNQVFAGPDQIICEGENIALDYGGFGNNPSWTPSTGLSCVFCPNPIASPSIATTYTVTIDDPIAGCSISDTIRVDVIPLSVIDAGEDVTICSGDSTQLNGIGFGSLSWSPSLPLDDPNSANPFATVFDETTFYLTAVSGNCILSDSVLVTTLDSANVDVGDVNICIGDSTSLIASGDASSFTWSPIDGLSNPNIANPTVNVLETTTYTVTASLGTCPDASANATVIVNPLPDDATIYPIHTFFPGQPVNLNIEQENAGTLYGYSWLPATDLTCYDCPDPVAILEDTTVFYTILVTDLETGCQTTLETELRPLGVCSPGLLAVPNAFTPNGDGNNDVLYVRSTGVADILTFKVFNRWGEQIFETDNISVGWDGTHNGKEVNPGVYVYYVQGICPIDGTDLFNKGNVTVIR